MVQNKIVGIQVWLLFIFFSPHLWNVFVLNRVLGVVSKSSNHKLQERGKKKKADWFCRNYKYLCNYPTIKISDFMTFSLLAESQLTCTIWLLGPTHLSWHLMEKSRQMLTRLRNSWKRFLHLQSKTFGFFFQSIFHFLGMKDVLRRVPKKHSFLQPLLTGVIFIYEICWLQWDDFHVWRLLMWLITAECFLCTHFRMPLYAELRRPVPEKFCRGLVATFCQAKNNLE